MVVAGPVGQVSGAPAKNHPNGQAVAWIGATVGLGSGVADASKVAVARWVGVMVGVVVAVALGSGVRVRVAVGVLDGRGVKVGSSVAVGRDGCPAMGPVASVGKRVGVAVEVGGRRVGAGVRVRVGEAVGGMSVGLDVALGAIVCSASSTGPLVGGSSDEQPASSKNGQCDCCDQEGA